MIWIRCILCAIFSYAINLGGAFCVNNAKLMPETKDNLCTKK